MGTPPDPVSTAGHGRRATDETGGDGPHELGLSPSTGAKALSDQDLTTLAQLGQHWRNAIAEYAVWEAALPVDPRLEAVPVDPRAGRFARVAFRRPEHDVDIEAQEEAHEHGGAMRRLLARLRRTVLGAPLRSTAVLEARMRKLVALPVLASDALSSVAYGPEALIAVLVLAGAGALDVALPIAGAIVVLMLVVGLSYRQTIRAYPRGGGSYIVASDNLGELPGLVAAAGLMLDYVLTACCSSSRATSTPRATSCAWATGWRSPTASSPSRSPLGCSTSPSPARPTGSSTSTRSACSWPSRSPKPAWSCTGAAAGSRAGGGRWRSTRSAPG
jgi:hypothetical protein